MSANEEQNIEGYRSFSVPESESEPGGETTVESLGLSAPQEKGGTCRRKEGGEVGEFKQACLIDVSPFFRAGCVL